MKYFALLGVLLLAIACSGKSDHGGFVAPSNGGANGGAGRPGHAGAGGGSGAGASSDAGAAGSDENSLAPIVRITSPKAVTDPNKGGVLTSPQVIVTCSAKASPEAGAAKVLEASVKIQLLGSDGKQIGMDGNVHSTDNADEYAATFTLTDVPDGAVTFVCSASDESVAANTATANLPTFVDHGPAVTLKNPAPASAHALTPAILFKFSVLPVLLTDADKFADVTAVSLKVNNVEIEGVAAHEVPSTPGEYAVSIDLNDPSIFSPTPTGAVPVRIIATNARGTVRSGDFTFDVDSLGPVIQITAPAIPNEFVRGKVTLAFTVNDTPAGVDPATVQVVLNTVPHFFDPKNLWTNPTPNTFTYTFDTLEFTGKVQLTVVIHADDLAGNSSNAAQILYYLDNVPPIIDMAPPDVQEVVYQSEVVSWCSEPFAPLGDSPKDLDVIQTFTRPRAILWDVGNSAQDQDAFYYSGIDNKDTNTVPHLYFQTDPTKPLLKYSDPTKHGEFCNAIADETLPLVTLVPLVPAGVAYFPKEATSHSGVCGAGTETPISTPSKPLCPGGKGLSRVIQHNAGLVNPPVPVVYVIAPDAQQCTGTQFEITNVATKDGWICAAVSAIDITGNRAVSAPLHLCLDSDIYPGSPPCATSSVVPPTCMDDCVAPPHFAPVDGLIFKPH